MIPNGEHVNSDAVVSDWWLVNMIPSGEHVNSDAVVSEHSQGPFTLISDVFLNWEALIPKGWISSICGFLLRSEQFFHSELGGKANLS